MYVLTPYSQLTTHNLRLLLATTHLLSYLQRRRCARCGTAWRATARAARTSRAASAGLSSHVHPGPSDCTYGPRVAGSRVLNQREAQGSLPPGPHAYQPRAYGTYRAPWHPTPQVGWLSPQLPQVGWLSPQCSGWLVITPGGVGPLRSGRAHPDPRHNLNPDPYLNPNPHPNLNPDTNLKPHPITPTPTPTKARCACSC